MNTVAVTADKGETADKLILTAQYNGSEYSFASGGNPVSATIYVTDGQAIQILDSGGTDVTGTMVNVSNSTTYTYTAAVKLPDGTEQTGWTFRWTSADGSLWEYTDNGTSCTVTVNTTEYGPDGDLTVTASHPSYEFTLSATIEFSTLIILE